MSDQLDRTNRELLATISAYVGISYLWIVLLVGMHLLLRRQVLAGAPEIAAVCIICPGVLTGTLPIFMIRNGIQPFFLNLFGQEGYPLVGASATWRPTFWSVSTCCSLLVAICGLTQLTCMIDDLQRAGVFDAFER